MGSGNPGLTTTLWREANRGTQVGMSFRTVLSSALFLLVGCGGAAPPPAVKAPTQATKQGEEPEAKTTKGKLAQLLSQIPPAAPVLDALPVKARADLESLSKALGPEAKAQVLSVQGAEVRPSCTWPSAAAHRRRTSLSAAPGAEPTSSWVCSFPKTPRVGSSWWRRLERSDFAQRHSGCAAAETT